MTFSLLETEVNVFAKEQGGAAESLQTGQSEIWEKGHVNGQGIKGLGTFSQPGYIHERSSKSGNHPAECHIHIQLHAILSVQKGRQCRMARDTLQFLKQRSQRGNRKGPVEQR